MSGPVPPLHTKLSDDERTLLDADSRLSQIMDDALANKDLGTLVEAMSEKRSIERVFQASRWETFNQRVADEFFGGDV